MTNSSSENLVPNIQYSSLEIIFGKSLGTDNNSDIYLLHGYAKTKDKQQGIASAVINNESDIDSIVDAYFNDISEKLGPVFKEYIKKQIWK